MRACLAEQASDERAAQRIAFSDGRSLLHAHCPGPCCHPGISERPPNTSYLQCHHAAPECLPLVTVHYALHRPLQPGLAPHCPHHLKRCPPSPPALTLFPFTDPIPSHATCGGTPDTHRREQCDGEDRRAGGAALGGGGGRWEGGGNALHEGRTLRGDGYGRAAAAACAVGAVGHYRHCATAGVHTNPRVVHVHIHMLLLVRMASCPGAHAFKCA
eukprot:1149402-Pelagomonas_calceolata.AAC.6